MCYLASVTKCVTLSKCDIDQMSQHVRKDGAYHVSGDEKMGSGRRRKPAEGKGEERAHESLGQPMKIDHDHLDPFRGHGSAALMDQGQYAPQGSRKLRK